MAPSKIAASAPRNIQLNSFFKPQSCYAYVQEKDILVTGSTLPCSVNANTIHRDGQGISRYRRVLTTRFTSSFPDPTARMADAALRAFG
jgi:hypothetical protein